MEKYRRFGDTGTGVQPFVPEEGHSRGVGVLLTVGAFFVTVRLILLAVLAPLMLMAYMVPGLGSIFRVLVRAVFAAMGFFKITVKSWPVTATAASQKDVPPGPGDVILTNFCSYLDVLAHAGMRSTVFGFVKGDKVVLKGFLGGLKHATRSFPEANECFCSGKTVSLKEAVVAAKAKGVPLTLFFEGTPTNGKGVLSPHPGTIASLEPKTVKFHLVALSYYNDADRKRWSPCFTQVRPFTAHFLSLLSRPIHSLKIVNVTAAKTPQYSTMPDLTILQKTMVSRLCEAGSMGAMSLKGEDKQAFLDHWNATQNVAYAEPGSP